MKKGFVLILLCFCSTLFAQEEKDEKQKEEKTKSDFWRKVNFGGGFSLTFPNNSINLAITPTAIYNFNEQFSLGAGLGYRYSKTGDIKNNVYSLSGLALYSPVDQLQISGEFEQLFVNQKLGNNSYSYNYPSLHLGLAYRIGGFSSIGISYDVLYDKNKSIYSSPITPIIRVFF